MHSTNTSEKTIIQNNKNVESNYNNSILKGIKVLKCFSHLKPELSISQISKMCGMNQSTAYRIIVTLASEALLQKSPQTGNYKLGYAHLSLANQVITHDQMSQVARSELPRLAEETGFNANMACLFNGKALYICRMDAPNSRYSRALLGREAPIYCTALGKALIMDMEMEEMEALIGHEPLTQHTETTILSTKDLYEEIKSCRNEDFIFDNGEYHPEAMCIAAPVRGRNNEIIAAISISTEKLNFFDREKDKIIRSLIYTVKMVSIALGHQNSFV